MKTPHLLLLLVVLVPCLGNAQTLAPEIPPAPAPALTPAAAPAALDVPDPVVGNTVNAVFAAFGKPNGVMTMPDGSSLLMYDRGTVTIADGKVVDKKLLSVANYTAKVDAEAEQEAERQANIAHANALLQLLLADSTYQSMPTRDRLATLAKFDREHPGSEARKYESDLTVVLSTELNQQAQIDKLLNEVAQARAQAATYQQQAADAQKRLADQQGALRAQVDLARQQAAQPPTQIITNYSTPTVSTSNVPHSVVGGGGIVLTPNNNPPQPPFATNGTASSSGNTTSPAESHWVLDSDGKTMHLVPDSANGTPGS